MRNTITTQAQDVDLAQAAADMNTLRDALDGPNADQVRSLLKDFFDFPPFDGDDLTGSSSLGCDFPLFSGYLVAA